VPSRVNLRIETEAFDERLGFVFLAYGIVWTALLVYLCVLKDRLHKAAAELALLRSTADLHPPDKTG
jgi:CcmD family protein